MNDFDYDALQRNASLAATAAGSAAHVNARCRATT